MQKKGSEFTKTDFDFGWKKSIHPTTANLVFEYNRGDILDIGCATCSLYTYLKDQGWQGNYIGIDSKKYSNFEYPEDITLKIGNATRILLPQTDTVVLYNILEHIDENDAIVLLRKSLKVAKNVLINVPKRNEDLWHYGIVEYHQLDKTHKNCGFSKEELEIIVRKTGGKIVQYQEHEQIDARIGISLWRSEFPKRVIKKLFQFFRSKVFYSEIWCEVEPV